jgi:hypothetical protein
MNLRLNARWVGFPPFLLFLLLLCCPGCHVFERYRPFVVLVRDAETKKPIAQAEVDIAYPLKNPYLGPADSLAMTTGEGIARLKAAPNGDGGLVVTVSAQGYMAEEQFVSSKDVQALQPAHWFEAVERRPVTIVLELYSVEPLPAVDLVLPFGYRGIVKTEVKVDETVPCTPGQRRFSFPVPPSGVVEARVSPVFRHVAFPEVRARYADGPCLTASAKDQEVGFWWIQSQGNLHTYLVGLESDYARYPKTSGESGGRKKSGGGGGGRKGRGGKRGGGQQQPDASSGGLNP